MQPFLLPQHEGSQAEPRQRLAIPAIPEPYDGSEHQWNIRALDDGRVHIPSGAYSEKLIGNRIELSPGGDIEVVERYKIPRPHRFALNVAGGRGRVLVHENKKTARITVMSLEVLEQVL